MTPAQERNASIVAAMIAVTDGLPEKKGPAGPYRLYATSDLQVMASMIGDEWALDAHYADLGKVASFRVSADKKQFYVVSIKAKALPQWLPLLQVATVETRVKRVFH